MRFGRLLPALSVSVAAGALIVLTGTGAAATEPGRSAPAAITWNLAAPTALDSANRATLVTQRGARNYAGPNCPGKGWNCTTSTRVLQISTSSGQNKVECSRGTVTQTPQSCVIVQTGTNNLASCYQRTNSADADQNCSITQTGRTNIAHVNQSVNASGSDTQSATQAADVKQTSSGGSGFFVNGNQSFIVQSVKQSAGPAGGDGGTLLGDDDDDGNGSELPSALQMQDAHQTAIVEQDASGLGNNHSDVNQSQQLTARNALIQNQNTLGGTDDCVPGFPEGFPFDPNACANIDQSAVNGNDTSYLRQSIREDAQTDAIASQQQGSSNGGLDASLHQETLTGRIRSTADQDKDQDQDAAPGSTQLQYDPLRCCGVGSQIGGSGNSELINQSSTQAASDSSATQELAILGESNSPQGRCSVTQQASNNSASTPNSGEANPCAPPIFVLTTCFSGQSEGGCTPNPEGCLPFCSDLRERVFAKPNG